MLYIQRLFFNFLDEFTTPRFTVIGASFAARRVRLLLMNQHAWWPITFGMKESNQCVDRLTVLSFTASSEFHAWEFVYDLSAAGSCYQLH
jgi:hypothetical protein